jgi:O-antigen/teichoic acid export membrane protein
MVFAMLMLRVLGPSEAGNIHWRSSSSVVHILTNFGLNTLVTREVAKEPGAANRYLSNAICAAAAVVGRLDPFVAAFFLLRAGTKPLSGATVLAISLFAVGLLPSNISASFAAIFNAYERMEVRPGSRL